MVFGMVEVGRFKNGCSQPSFPHSPNLPAIRACHAGENFRETLRGANKNASNGLTVESAEMGFIAGEEDLAPVLDGGGEHGAVFFWEEKVEARDGQGGRAREAGDGLCLETGEAPIFSPASPPQVEGRWNS